MESVALPMVPVKVKAHGSDPVITFAFLDSGSNSTFCSEQLLQRLKIEGKKTNLSLSTIHAENSPVECQVVDLELYDPDENERLKEKYVAVIDDYLAKGYAEKVPEDELDRSDGVVWYLPHHPVLKEEGPGKVRPVFDCAARYHKISLNDCLYQGPDLNNNMIGVLTRFRQEPIALMSDIESMFNQVHVTPEQCDALRFLWWPGGNTELSPEDFRMKVHLFGATSSPSCSIFALNKTAEDNRELYSEEAVNTVKNNFYVDDCLKSVPDEDSAVDLVEELREMLSRGGFRLTKWLTNSRRVAESIPECERAKSMKYLDFDGTLVERALGLSWCVQSDTFGFKVKVKDKPPTRRGILSLVSSVFDPLGFAGPFLIPAKVLLQDLCRMKLGWDDDIPELALVMAAVAM